ncbi:MAG: hypothetical protein Q8P82_01385, partial [bacterium]|nr:hypothetical protein [bacterium]
QPPRAVFNRKNARVVTGMPAQENLDKRQEWRNRNRDRFNESKKRNYAKGRRYARHTREFWSDWEILQIAADDRPSDRELARTLRRSVQAIQVKRSRLK